MDAANPPSPPPQMMMEKPIVVAGGFVLHKYVGSVEGVEDEVEADDGAEFR